MEALSQRILNNFLVTEKVIRFCKQSGFSSYRLSSDLTPVINHPEVNLRLQDLPNAASIFEALSSIAKAVSETGLKISAHPSEYISLTSPKEEVISNSTRDLASHAELFDLIGLPQSYEAPLNIHCRRDEDPEIISNDFIRNYDRLPHNVKSRLVVEVNDNKDGVWSIKNLYKYFYQKAKIPLIICTTLSAIMEFQSAKLLRWLTLLGVRLLYSTTAKVLMAQENTLIMLYILLQNTTTKYFGM